MHSQSIQPYIAPQLWWLKQIKRGCVRCERRHKIKMEKPVSVPHHCGIPTKAHYKHFIKSQKIVSAWGKRTQYVSFRRICFQGEVRKIKWHLGHSGSFQVKANWMPLSSHFPLNCSEKMTLAIQESPESHLQALHLLWKYRSHTSKRVNERSI